MPPRRYLPEKQVAPPRAIAKPETRQIPLDAKLYDLKDASILLSEQFGSGYSVRALRRLIESGEWVEGWHYMRRGKFLKIYLPAVQEWQLRG
ncbi:hypothetical protein NDA01_24130 [Trichocoleus desertorum AS-A10]|uniref:hypothetical protein n=1 Tax=Trichocoleus desertorum TaxID=1481672 RepID=UPI00329776C6